MRCARLAFSAFARPRLFGMPQNNEAALADIEHELDLGLGPGIRKVRAQRGGILLAFRWLAEQGEGHRAEDRGFSRACP